MGLLRSLRKKLHAKKKEHLKVSAPTLTGERAAVVVGVTDAEVLADAEKEK